MMSRHHSYFCVFTQFQVLAFDPDPGPIGMVRYRIVTEFDSAGSFSIDAESGEISVASRLDFDAR